MVPIPMVSSHGSDPLPNRHLGTAVFAELTIRQAPKPFQVDSAAILLLSNVATAPLGHLLHFHSRSAVCQVY